jgi:hypothetical protein
MLYMPKVFSQRCAPFGHAQVACSIAVDVDASLDESPGLLVFSSMQDAAMQ